LELIDSKDRRSLGRGLRSLIPDSQPVEGEKVLEVEIELIDRNPMQPRKDFREEAMEDLKNSIREVGVLSPILVQRIGGRFQIINGERRVQASKLAGRKTIPAIVRETDSEGLLMLALIENVQRENLNEMELADAYQLLRDKFFLTQNQIADKVGKSRSVIANTLRLLELSQNIQEAVRKGEITAGHARALIALDEDKRARVLEIIRRKNLSVRDVELLANDPSLLENGKGKEKGADDETSVSRKSSVASLDPDTRRILDIIQERLRTKVEVQQSKRGKEGGKIVIHYYGDDDFKFILQEFLNLVCQNKVKEIMEKVREIDEKLDG